ncbi:MAG TPA: c-type cytochrome [Thermoanaerobaculia bacterium]
MRTTAIITLALLASCSSHPLSVTASLGPAAIVHASVRLADGNPGQGREIFTKLRCDSCHSVGPNAARSPHPLPDLSAQPPEAIAALIVQKTDVAPEALFDEIAMSSAASRLTESELAHVVAYLRHPQTAR